MCYLGKLLEKENKLDKFVTSLVTDVYSSMTAVTMVT